MPRSIKITRAWRHNSYTGQCVWFHKSLQGMLSGDTLTDEARLQAHIVNKQLEKLQRLLKSRKD